MSTDHFINLAGAKKDFETGLPVIPFGTFSPFAPYAKNSRQPASIRKLPVLRAEFDRSLFDPLHPERRCGFGAVQLKNVLALAFRIQSGPDSLYWLANPADAEVWKVIDQWVAAKRMVLAAEFGDDAMLIAGDFFEPAPMRALRMAAQNSKTVTAAFAAAASKAILTDELIGFVRTDLANYPKLRSVQTRMVCTEATGTVAVMVDHGEMPDNPVAAAARKIAEQMSMPGATRH